MRCPVCHSQTKEGITGEYCCKCGLLIDSFYDASPSYKFRRKLKADTKSQQKQIYKKLKKCETCGSMEDLTLHHIIPKRVLKKMKPEERDGKKILLCRKCHNLADKMAEAIYPKEVEIK